MAREFAKAFYNSKAWRDTRTAFIKYRVSVDGGMCQVCGEKFGYIVHHKIWLTPENINNPETTLCFDNLQFDCLECHNKEDENKNNQSKTKRRYTFNSDGSLCILPP